MVTVETLNKVETLLKALSIPFHTIKVFGSHNINIHIVTVSEETAKNWYMTLNRFCKNKVTMCDWLTEHKTDKSHTQLPSTYKAYLITAVM